MTRTKTTQIDVGGDAAMGRVTASMASKVLVLAPPWVVLVLLLILGHVGHSMWGEPPAVTWAAMAGTLCSVILGGLTWSVSHSRGPLGRFHTTATAGGASLWFTVAMVTGPTAPVTLGMWFFGGFTLAVGWNIRLVIRAQTGSDVTRAGDPLAALFDQAKASFGLEGSKVRTRAVTDHKIQAELELPSGKKVVDDVAKRTGYMESGMGFPAGAVQVAASEARADRAHLTITDPQLMKKSLPWEGPSLPGGSIAEPLRIGLFQDAEPALHTIVGHHLQVMGMSGSGKSIGSAWNYLSEIITRRDVVVMAADITKGDQTLGPFKPALHRFETTAAGARALISDIQAEIKPRTDYLAARGMQKWEEGCGLDYWVIWLEEVPDIIDALGDKGGEKLLKILKALRSAGGTVVMSLQRSDYSQMPTLARGQLAHMCLGVANSQDASFGLSEQQQEAEARPELWGAKRPGMAYLDAPSIPETHVAMPLRTYAWGEGPKAAAAIAAHVAAYPAAAKKTTDPFTAKVARMPEPSSPEPVSEPISEEALESLAAVAERIVLTQRVDLAHVPPAERARLLEVLERKGIIGPARENGERQVLIASADDDALTAIIDDGDAVGEHLRTADPSPDITAGPDDDIADLTEEEAVLETPPQTRRRLTPAESRAVLHTWLRQRAATGRAAFAMADLAQVRADAGDKSRAWAYKALRTLESEGVISKSGEGWVIEETDLLAAPLSEENAGQPVRL